MMSGLLRLVLWPAAALALAGTALAQERTTATFGDWTLRCEARPAPAPRVCEIVHGIPAQGQGGLVAQIAIGQPVPDRPLQVVFQVPINVWLPGNVLLAYGAKNELLPAVFKRCLPSACIADAVLEDVIVKALRAQTQPARLLFKDVAQRDVAVPVSFKGFASAFDAMAKEMAARK